MLVTWAIPAPGAFSPAMTILPIISVYIDLPHFVCIFNTGITLSPVGVVKFPRGSPRLSRPPLKISREKGCACITVRGVPNGECK